jgi:hypothetical protein
MGWAKCQIGQIIQPNAKLASLLPTVGLWNEFSDLETDIQISKQIRNSELVFPRSQFATTNPFLRYIPVLYRDLFKFF